MRACRKLCCIVLLVTSGALVAAQPEPSAISITSQESGVDASFRGLAVRNRREAWVTGSNGTVIRTTDAGQTWHRVAVPDSADLDFRDVELLRDGTVLLMSVGTGTASRLLRSTDAGNTWRTVLVNQEETGFFDGMAFRRDGQHGVLFGDPVNGRWDVYKTHTAGATWERLPLTQRPRSKEGEHGFAASGSGIVAQERTIWIATGGSVARVLKSEDDGATWAAYETGIRCGDESAGIFSIDVIDQTTAVAIGGNYSEPERDRNNVATSVDGGKTWIAPPAVSMPHKACVRSLGQGQLLACGRTGVTFSADAGQTWTTISNDSYYTLAFDRSSGSGFLAGKDGRVARFELSPSDQ